MLVGHGNGGSSFGLILVNEDWFYNWDFHSQTAVESNADMPVTFLFFNNAEIDKVKNWIGWGGLGDLEHMKLSDGAGPVWDSDSGKKDGCYIYAADTHYRVYADGDDRMYNSAYHYYVIGTTHHDVGECSPSPDFGWSEDAADDLGDRIAYCCANSYGNWFLWRDAIDYYNKIIIPYRDGDHYYQNNGMADEVLVP